MPKQPNKAPKSSVFKCHCCNESFAYKSQLIIHESSHKQTEKCQVCSRRIFKSKLSNHMKMHLDNNLRENEKTGERFKKQVTVTKDEEIAVVSDSDSKMIEEKPKTADNHQITPKLETEDSTIEPECIENQEFIKTNQKSLHRPSFSSILSSFKHKPEKSPLVIDSFNCPTCFMAFKHQSSLLLHEIKHRVSKFTCDLCGKTFDEKLKLMLEVHMNVRHGNKRVLRCNKCDFKTQKHQELGTHKLTHRKIKLKCDKCRKNFKTELLLSEHKSAVHAKKDYSCELCGKFFKTDVNVRRHIRTVHSLGTIQCMFCDRFFLTRDELSEHIGDFWRINKCSGLLSDHSEVLPIRSESC